MQIQAIDIFRVQDITADKCPIGPRGAETMIPGRSDSDVIRAAFKCGRGHISAVWNGAPCCPAISM